MDAATKPNQGAKKAAEFVDEIDSHHDSSAFANTETNKKEKAEAIAKTEGKLVFGFKMLAFSVLILSAVAVCTWVYLYTTGKEEEAFDARYHNDATKVVESIGTTFKQTLGSTDAFITQLVAYARYSNSSWPFVTMPAFGIHATKLLKLSRAFYFSVYPFVKPGQVDQWLDYTNKTNGWIHESLDIQAKDEDWWGPTETSFGHRHEIFGKGGQGVNEPFDYMNNFLPSWQVHPMVPSAGYGFPYNYDIWQIEELAHAILHAGENNKVVVSPPVNIVYDPTSEDSIAAAAGQNNWASSFTRPDLDTSEPFSVITLPIYDSLETVKLDPTKDLPFVGIVTFSLYWRELIENILPTGSDGVIVVFEDECAPSFTYRLDGPEAIYLGQGDLHDATFDGIKQSILLSDMVNSKKSTEHSSYSSYTGLPISEDFCAKTIRIYPSKDLKDDHTTTDPILFTIMAAAIFLFTSSIFIIYDFWVTRRQSIVMQRALASGAIVSSLFPKAVRQQLLIEEEQRIEKQKENSTKAFLYNTQTQSMDGSGERRSSSRPIADEFENTTIFFADLVGFTAWSAKRTPVEVFELLEAIYGQFDKVAARRKVFKVETIGDCYVAVTGIPDPQKNHAVIMARFAHDCMRDLRHVTHDLADKLGEDTKDLAMRVGLHSGPVTAGVLRGEKGRFQLFGDSVNTAARMEQNGMPGRIHVSQACADALMAAGKEKWLVTREDKVSAKGLGELSTHWVEVKGEGSRASLTSLSSDGLWNSQDSLALVDNNVPISPTMTPADEYSGHMEV